MGHLEVEYHIWYHGEDHHDINMNRIEKEAQQNISKINLALKTDVDSAIKSKQDAEYRSRLAKQRAKQEQIKSTSPYVSK